MYQKIKIKYLCMLCLFVIGTMPFMKSTATNAQSCPDLKLIFIRGSGEELNSNRSYQAFKSTLEPKIKTTSLTYEFTDLAYPAIAVGIDNLGVTLGALFSSGESFAFGDSVNTGVKMLNEKINNESCKNTRFIIAGYSQGAMVISKTLSSLNSDRIIYAATIGDPKIYLPEGGGLFPAACRGQNLSDYRSYVPDCYAHEGLLGSYQPYEPSNYVGKLGTWCNKYDIFCSSLFSTRDHTSYVDDHLYDDIAKTIFAKITNYFHIEGHILSPHDTAILIDSTGSMAGLIEKYKAEALRLAKETLDSGGRVALYDYRDLNDPYTPKEHCNFETCTLEVFKTALESIEPDGGGDIPESLLSASLNMMKKLTWKFGSTKSIIVLTDANFHTPDIDNVTITDVAKLSREIDPVNFYIITEPSYENSYLELAELTDGKVVTNTDELSLLTDYIMERYDSLPTVEYSEEQPAIVLTIEHQTEQDGQVILEYKTNADSVIVMINDTIIGMTNEEKITITDLDLTKENHIRLIPIKSERRGDAQEVIVAPEEEFIPLAPKTGIR